jgi:hypothetical protein
MLFSPLEVTEMSTTGDGSYLYPKEDQAEISSYDSASPLQELIRVIKPTSQK